MTDADDDNAHPWLALAQSLVGGLLLLAYMIVPGMLAVEVPEWPALILAFIVIGPHVSRFERAGSVIERVLERVEKLVKEVRGFDPRDKDPTK